MIRLKTLLREAAESTHANNIRLILNKMDSVFDAFRALTFTDAAASARYAALLGKYQQLKLRFQNAVLDTRWVRAHEADVQELIDFPRYFIRTMFDTDWWERVPALQDVIPDLETFARGLENFYDEQRGSQLGDMFGGEKL